MTYVNFIEYKCIKLFIPPPALRIRIKYGAQGLLDDILVLALYGELRVIRSGFTEATDRWQVFPLWCQHRFGIFGCEDLWDDALGIEFFSCAVRSCSMIIPVSYNPSKEVLRFVTEFGSMTSCAALLFLPLS